MRRVFHRDLMRGHLAQRAAILLWKKRLDDFCDATPNWLDEKEVLADPGWKAIREGAKGFIAAFEDKWPPP